MLETQKYLKSGKTLINLKEDFAIDHSIDNNVVALNYNMISSPMKEEICKECRGLILQLDTWDVLAYPFYKFFNMGEGGSENINWKTIRYYEKLDGSMLIMWFDASLERWQFGTRSVPRGNNKLNGLSVTFADLAWQGLQNVLNEPVNDFILKFNKRYTYIFELTSPYNRVVCDYKDIKMTLIGVRSLDTLKELQVEGVAKELGLPVPVSYNFANIDDMISIINMWDPIEHEGVVVVDNNFNRVKVKNLAYCAMHGAISSVSASNRNLMKVIILGKDDDLVPVMNDLILEKTTRIKKKYSELLIKIEKEWNELKDIENIKEFALQAQNKTWPAVLFALKRNKTDSVNSFMVDCSNKQSSIDTILKFIKEEV